MSKTALAPRWYGHLLAWTPAAGGQWSARHAGREYRMAELDRRATSGRPGWYLAAHPDEPPGLCHLGPFLGRDLGAARRLAEVYAITDPEDRYTRFDTPNLVTVIADGAAFPTPAGRMLLASPDLAQARITIHTDQPACTGLFTPGPPTGAITPTLVLPADPAHQVITVTWQPVIFRGPALAPEPAWHAAARSFGQAIG